MLGQLTPPSLTSPELLKEIYGDLAKPGVAQVGKAFATIMETGCLALLPLRLLNQRARAWEEKTFSEFASRLANEDISEVNSIPPELGVPILEKLRVTVDEDLRDLFLNLLVNSSLDRKSEDCHPSFSHVISQICPDEARLIKAWNGKRDIPYLSIYRSTNEGVREIQKFVLDVPEEIVQVKNVEIYLNNLAGLGLLEFSEDFWISDESQYKDAIDHVKSRNPEILPSPLHDFESSSSYPDEYLYFQKGVIRIQAYGLLFQSACVIT